MAKKLAQRTTRRKRSHQADRDKIIIPIDHETAEIIAQQGSCFENSLAVIRGRTIHCFSTQPLPLPNSSATRPKKKYGRAYCRLPAILE